MSGKKDKTKKDAVEVPNDGATEKDRDDEIAESGELPSDEAAASEDDDDDAGGPPTRRMLEEEQPSYGNNFETEPHIKVVPAVHKPLDPEMTLDLTGDALDAILRDDSKEPSPLAKTIEAPTAIPQGTLGRDHLKGLIEALIFASDKPLRAAELARSAAASLKEVNLLLAVLKAEYSSHGVQLDEVAGGWIFRTHVAFAPFVRDMAKQKPVRLTRAQVETLAILAYRQPITRPEIDDIRGVDCGPVLKLLLERDLVKILGKKDEPGRPILYGTTSQFLEFFGLKSLKDLPTLREFTELNEDSRRTVEKELGDVLEAAQPAEGESAATGESAGDVAVDDVPTDVHSSKSDSPPPQSSESVIDPPDETVTAMDDDLPSENPDT